MFDHPEFDGHELLAEHYDAATGLKAVVAIHSTALGPAFGGCRMYLYASSADAVRDALRLSHGMTCKAAICGLPWGGGKSVIIADPRTMKTPALLKAMGRLVESLGGRYIAADDVGTTLADLMVMRSETRHTAAATPTAQQSLPVTAHGVLHAILAAARHALGTDDLAGVRVAVQGLGNVGLPLAEMLAARGARLVLTDIDAGRLTAAAARLGAGTCEPALIYDAEADIFAPCALGGILGPQTIPRLKARIVCGGANNQLASVYGDDLLAARAILYVPDFIANAGGVIDFDQERIDDRPEAVLAAVRRIGEVTRDVLEASAREGRRPLAVANAIVRERLAQAARAKASS